MSIKHLQPQAMETLQPKIAPPEIEIYHMILKSMMENSFFLKSSFEQRYCFMNNAYKMIGKIKVPWY